MFYVFVLSEMLAFFLFFLFYSTDFIKFQTKPNQMKCFVSIIFFSRELGFLASVESTMEWIRGYSDFNTGLSGTYNFTFVSYSAV